MWYVKKWFGQYSILIDDPCKGFGNKPSDFILVRTLYWHDNIIRTLIYTSYFLLGLSRTGRLVGSQYHFVSSLI
jgi:hypothetical protein